MEDFVIGKHNAAISCIRYASSKSIIWLLLLYLDCVISASWDGSLCLWNANETSLSQPLQSLSIRPSVSPSAKIYSLDLGEKYFCNWLLNSSILAIATNTLQVVLYDIRQLHQPMDIRDTRLGYNLRSIRMLSNETGIPVFQWWGVGYAVGCIEGRVHIDYLPPYNQVIYSFFYLWIATQNILFQMSSEGGRWGGKDFPCKHHRQTSQVLITFYIHSRNPCLVTGGSDGIVSFWDYQLRKRITQLDKFSSSIACLAFNHTGDKLAIASSYLFENGKMEYDWLNTH